MRLVTSGPAQLEGTSEYGRIAADSLADFVVLASNPLKCKATDIGQIGVLATVISGEIVYQVPSFVVDEPVRQRRARSRAPRMEVILDAAAELFEERGFQNATMQDLADRLGIAKPTVYAHAKGKTEILEGIFERVLRDVDARVARAREEDTPAQQLQYLIISLTEAGSQLRAQYKVFFADERELPSRLVRYYRRWSAETLGQIREVIREGQRRGELEADVDPTVAAFALIGLANWTARWFDPDGRLSIEEVAAAHWRILSSGLGSRTALVSRPE